MDVIMPQLGETVAEGTVTRWYKKVGDAVRADEALFDVETDKVSTEIPAPASGVLAEIVIGEGVTAKVGARLAVIRESGSAGAASSAPQQKPAAPAAPHMTARAARTAAPRADAGERLSPVVRKLCAEHGIDPKEISGTGRDGRITRDDVLEHIATRGAAAAHPVARPTPAAPRPASSGALNTIRRRTAEHMAKSWTSVPHVMQAVEVDFHRVVAARRHEGEAWKQREGYALTYLPFIVRAVSVALAKFPKLNATFDGGALNLGSRINIGIAVDLDFEGLVVPVLKDVPAKSLPQIAREIQSLAARARSGALKPDDLTEATYTITNNGAFGTLFTAPIINAPQVAILSTDAVRKKPVVIEAPEGDSLAIRPVGLLAQSFDHRAVDGAYGAAFLQEVKSTIETRDWMQALRA
ncbi:MAG TPA: dihydrolipoamide acetyltransferase family protein [Burkholderiales bacterium]|nr:dihydrolipoamide acetyltransferase family protein [Burkholderiales bacterium]